MNLPLIYAGIHQPSMAQHLPRVMVSVNRLLQRRSDFQPQNWILDSGAFSRITSGRGHLPVRSYAQQARRWSRCGNLQAVVTQDWMCEPFVLELTGLTVEEHQRRTTRNYLQLREELEGDIQVMPVIQGYTPEEYAQHTQELSQHLTTGAWVGLGSLCRRQSRSVEIAQVQSAVLRVRPDLRLHGFGVKTTALTNASVALRMHSVDSMAWSYAARREEAAHRRNSTEACQEWLRRVEAIRPRNAQAPMGI